MKRYILLLVLALFSFQAVAADKIEKIVIEGNHRIEDSTVLSYITIVPGDIVESGTLDASLKRLFDTGFFADVGFKVVGNTLHIAVKENPIISNIYFEGNNRLEDDILLAEISLKPRSIYTKSKVQKDVERIIDSYRRMGRYAVTVDAKIIERSQNRIDLIFEINEGPSTYISKINFIGNKKYSSPRLREELMSKEYRWYRFLTTTDTYDEDRFNYDKELLRRFYSKSGYIDFKIDSAIAELAPDKSSFFITIKLTEGKRYRFGEISINSSIPGINMEQALKQVDISKGDYYNEELVDAGIQNLADILGSYGFAFVDIEPSFKKNEEKQTVDIVFNIREGRRIYVNRIDIKGNVRTEDRVIRREMRLSEGDAFNTAKFKRSRRNIENLGFFSSVEMTPENIGGDKMNIAVEVEEASTGSLSFGVGWSTYNGAMIEAALREANFLGKGLDVSLKSMFAVKRTQYDFSFTNPYFLDRNLSAGFDLFYITQDVRSESSYDLDTAGGSLRLGWKYTDDFRHVIRYTLRQEDVTNVRDDASIYVKNRAGKSTLSSVSHTLTYDKRDNRFIPSEGYLLTLSNEVAGLGGDVNYLKTDVGAAYYHPLVDQVTLEISGTGGYNFSTDGGDIGLGYRYYLGGSKIRGFENYGIGARDRASGDALGGNWYAAGTLQVSFPIGLPSELGIRGRVFNDVGIIGRPDDIAKYDVDYDSSLRASFGFGIGWTSPLGVISIDIAKAYLKEDYDETETIRLTFGTGF